MGLGKNLIDALPSPVNFFSTVYYCRRAWVLEKNSFGILLSPIKYQFSFLPTVLLQRTREMIHHIRLGKNATRLDPIRKKILAAVLLHGWYKRLRNNSILTEFFFSFLTTVHGGFFLTKDMQTPPQFWSGFHGWWGVCCIVWEKNMKKFSNFYFSSYGWKFW